MKDWIGVDFGSKLAGTTAVYYYENLGLKCIQSEKKQDSDIWLNDTILNLNAEYVFMDAPLSLPGAYFGTSDQYFYRACDKLTQAMSPMFLGGLTARAIKLKDSLPNVTFIETYPAYLIKQVLLWKDIYTNKEKINISIIKEFENILPYEIITAPSNWHQFDALACWYSGYRYFNKNAIEFGDKGEGVITV